MFVWLEELVTFLLKIINLELNSAFYKALHFFIYDTVKIFILLVSIIYIITFIRSYFPIEKIKDYITSKNRVFAHILAAIFGVLTPFCSCSAVPLFLGFLQARIPLGVTFSYLISAPLSDAVVIAMLFSLFGWKIAFLYVSLGILIAVIAGLIIGALNLEKEVLIEVKPIKQFYNEEKTTFILRLKLSLENSFDILKKIYLYVIIGVGVGAFIHGYIPTDFISKYANGDSWYAPIIAVIMGIPMYSNAVGILPLIEVLTQKGMLLGTALSFMMSVVALSLPEAMILKRVLSVKLISIFFFIVGCSILFVGYLFNLIL